MRTINKRCLAHGILSCILIGGFLLSCKSNVKNDTGISKNSGSSQEDITKISLEKRPVVQCDNNMTNLFFHDYTVLIVGHDECQPCALIKNELCLPSDIHIHAFYLDILKSDKHRMIAEALRTSGFPTVYLIDGNFEIQSILRRTVNLESMLSSSIIESKNIIEEKIGNLDDIVIHKMLSASLKATLALNEEKYEDAKKVC